LPRFIEPVVAGRIASRWQGWAGKSLENMGKSLIFGCDLRKLCEEWNL
jgi:hypothetical protein